jgi:hypothetical protein
MEMSLRQRARRKEKLCVRMKGCPTVLLSYILFYESGMLREISEVDENETLSYI